MSLRICVGVRHAFRTLSKGFETCVLVFDVELTSIVRWYVQYLLGHWASPKHREQRAKPTRACGFNQGRSQRTVDTLPLEAHGAGASSGFFCELCIGVRRTFRILTKRFETCVLVFDVDLTFDSHSSRAVSAGHAPERPSRAESNGQNSSRADSFNQGRSQRTIDTLPLEAHGAEASSGFFMACTVTDKTPLGAHPICCSQSEYRSSLPVAWSLTATPAAQRRQQAHTLHRRTQNSAKPTTLPISGLKIKTIRAQTCILPSLFLLSFLHLWFRQGDHLRDEELA